MQIDKAFYRCIHRYGFRSGQLAEIIGVKIIEPGGDLGPRICWELLYADGVVDYAPIDNKGAYEFFRWRKELTIGADGKTVVSSRSPESVPMESELTADFMRSELGKVIETAHRSYLRCTMCGRKSWDIAEANNNLCGMTQPNGTRCEGRMVKPESGYIRPWIDPI